MPYPPISSLPTAPSRVNSPDTFMNLADAFCTALSTMQTQMNALAVWEQATADAVTATAATAISAPGTSATSATSVAMATGAVAMTVQTGKSLVPGMFVTAAYTTTPTICMFGQITAYNSGTGLLNLAITSIVGSGTYALWTVAISGMAQDFTPVGSVIQVPAIAAPAGYLKLNGSLLLRSVYSGLWTYAQSSGNLAGSDAGRDSGNFSPGDGSTNFRLPDMRGYHIRSADDGRGIDSGRAVGSTQADQVTSHNHGISDPTHAHGVYDPSHGHSVNDPGHAHSVSIDIMTTNASAAIRGTANGADGGSKGTSSSATGVVVNGAYTGISTYGVGTGISVSNCAGGAEIRVKSIALLACIKY